MIYVLETALELGCVYALVTLGLFLSYRILDIADLTTDGSFVFGMATSVAITAMGHPFLGLLCGLLAGGIAGFVTASLQTRMGVPSILAGIITNTGLYTINLMVMGWSSNLSLLKKETIFTILARNPFLENHVNLIVFLFVIISAMFLMKWFLNTHIGLSIRATGDNKDMVLASSINPQFTITIGLILANCLTGLSGALVGQMQKSADVNAGNGIVVVGLACLIIGETIVHAKNNINRSILACLLGNIFYRLIYAFVLRTHIIPIEGLKLMTAIIVAIAIAMPTLKQKAQLQMKQRKEF